MANAFDFVLDQVLGVGSSGGGTVASVVVTFEPSTVPPGMQVVVTGVDIGCKTNAPNSFDAALVIAGTLLWVDLQNVETGEVYMSWRGRVAVPVTLEVAVEASVTSLIGANMGVTVSGELVTGQLDYLT